MPATYRRSCCATARRAEAALEPVAVCQRLLHRVQLVVPGAADALDRGDVVPVQQRDGPQARIGRHGDHAEAAFTVRDGAGEQDGAGAAAALAAADW